jgi:hypothetical protein
MINFFRKIRKQLADDNKPMKYLRYAIGEILLVVIGILIALSINNWNEARKNNLKESLLVKNIIEDLKLDSIHINKSLNEVANQMEAVDNLIAKVLDSTNILNYDTMGYIRFSTDFRPISQRNHAESVSNLENVFVRKLLQDYFLKEDEIMDFFTEYVDIIHNKIRPYLTDVGMHDLKSLYEEYDNLTSPVFLQPKILEEQLGNVRFQQLLFERRLKTSSVERLLKEMRRDNQELIKVLSLNNNQ